MEASDQFHVSVALPIEYEAGWLGPKVGLDELENRKISFPAGNRTQDHPARSLVAMPTALSRLPVKCSRCISCTHCLFNYAFINSGYVT